ncbi:MSMEG_0570 family nitrogen starvation response protein [Pseudomonas syringae USA007]|uniref:MSMEG_0570 family nitrogen starvation response protein n=1 Tax=Pseudomonas syringae USA007 TaxID=1357288 RepID=A0AAU8M369_PSESX|nr:MULTISPECIES: MSMEG_0570 family nitrogen starvation response protein [Pseudomonas syringae group]MCR8719495.1 MSMEG_0570 family nitrogen starvation response protein [Pseudomonas syringae]
MAAVNFKIRWPNGREATGYSPSTVIYQYLEEGASYPLPDFLQRIESAMNDASERVKQVKGFYCSSAMDTLSSLKGQASYLVDPALADGQVDVLSMRTEGASHQVNAGWSSF